MVIILFRYLIENYINNMTINDIIMFSHKENIYLCDSEYLEIFDFIKKNYQFLLDNKIDIKKYLDSKFEMEKSEKIYELFLKYQKKYSSYL